MFTEQITFFKKNLFETETQGNQDLQQVNQLTSERQEKSFYPVVILQE